MPNISDLPKSVQNALRKGQKKEQSKQNREFKQGTSWINTLEDARALLDAIENNKKKVTLSGKIYNVSPSKDRNRNAHYVYPANGMYVPCGFFTALDMRMLIAVKESEAQ